MPDWELLLPFVDRCQILVGLIGIANPLSLVEKLRILISDLPPALAPTSQLVLSALLLQTTSRLAEETGLIDRPEIAGGITTVSGAVRAYDCWRLEFVRLLDRCREALRVADSKGGDSKHTHRVVTSIRELIDARHADPTLTCIEAATSLRLSPSHTARLLKVHTGETFAMHVRRRRVDEACELLVHSNLTMKEIARAVGFGDASRFSRQFRLVMTLTPTKFRQQSARQ